MGDREVEERSRVTVVELASHFADNHLHQGILICHQDFNIIRHLFTDNQLRWEVLNNFIVIVCEPIFKHIPLECFIGHVEFLQRCHILSLELFNKVQFEAVDVVKRFENRVVLGLEVAERIASLNLSLLVFEVWTDPVRVTSSLVGVRS